ncbi:MAG: response regulator [Acidobacteriia bacterium]|nr:response regulator [Terriglobia bacterium]
MSTTLRLLMIEDSEDDATLLLRELQRGGFDVLHERVDTAAAMSEALAREEWDLVVSDHSMPHFSGIDALNILRARRADVPFIFVSGTIGEETAVSALKGGAQDYLMKTNLKRLVPAIQRELREAAERRERKRLELQVQQLQKFEAIGRLAGGIAHDFNNVVGAIMGWADLGYEETQADSHSHDRFHKIREQANRAARLTSQLLAFARRQVLQKKKININEVVEEGTSLLQRVIGENIEIRRNLAADLRVALADPTQIDQVVVNLCLNARDAMPKGGRLTIETKNVEIGEDFCRIYTYGRPGSYVLLTISDTGTGMDAATVEHIFEPFFTTKEVGRGTGLGLSTVYGVVKQHDGMINVESEPSKGTTFRIYLPAHSGTAERREAERKESPRKGSERILLAEDHDGLREAAQEMLEGLGYHLVLASNGLEAVERFKADYNGIDMVILDVVMPGLDGPEAYTQMCEIRPNLGVLFTTGYTSELEALSSLMQKGASMLQKPYDSKSLSQMIRSVLDRETASHRGN